MKSFIADMKQVHWTSPKTIITQLGVVVGIVTLFTVFIGGLDFGLQSLMKLLIGG